MLDIPTDLPAELAPLAWLIGEWEGTGVIEYETDERRYTGEFTHRVSFRSDGDTALSYDATARLHEGDSPLVAERGFWRLSLPAGGADPGPGLLPAPDATAASRTADDIEALRNDGGGFDIEALIVHADGVSELYLGQISGPRIDLATDAVVRTAGARAYAAATRMYGLVDGHLLWAWDIAAVGGELASHASARLARVS